MRLTTVSRRVGPQTVNTLHAWIRTALGARLRFARVPTGLRARPLAQAEVTTAGLNQLEFRQLSLEGDHAVDDDAEPRDHVAPLSRP